MTVTTRSLSYPADGLTMVSHLALPAGEGRRPAVLVGPEGPGLNAFQRRRADALAELGYVALAFDIHGGRWFSDPEEMLARCLPLLDDPDRMRDIGGAALDALRAEERTDPDRIAAIGYGTGGAQHAFHHPPVGPDQELLPGVGYHPRHAARAWDDVVGLLAECLPLGTGSGSERDGAGPGSAAV